MKQKYRCIDATCLEEYEVKPEYCHVCAGNDFDLVDDVQHDEPVQKIEMTPEPGVYVDQEQCGVKR